MIWKFCSSSFMRYMIRSQFCNKIISSEDLLGFQACDQRWNSIFLYLFSVLQIFLFNELRLCWQNLYFSLFPKLFIWILFQLSFFFTVSWTWHLSWFQFYGCQRILRALLMQKLWHEAAWAQPKLLASEFEEKDL